MIELLWPYALLLLPLPALAWRFLPPLRNAEEAALRAPFFESWANLESDIGQRRQGLRTMNLILLGLAWLGLVLALTRPTWVGEPIALPATGRDLLLAVDISGSMQVQDMQQGQNYVRRIDAVKQVVGDFVERRRGDRIGLILFGTNAYVQTPLTFDTDTVRRFLNEAQLGFAGRDTAIGDAIGLAVKRLRERSAANRVLILLTDGANTAGEVEPQDAAGLATDNGVRIHTVGVGADSMVKPGLFGSSFGARKINPSADLDETTLQAIADSTGGRYFRARHPAELVEIYELLDELEPVDQDESIYRPRASLFHWPAAVGLLSMLGLLIRVAVRG